MADNTTDFFILVPYDEPAAARITYAYAVNDIDRDSTRQSPSSDMKQCPAAVFFTLNLSPDSSTTGYKLGVKDCRPSLQKNVSVISPKLLQML
jgi:hypothetical protein